MSEILFFPQISQSESVLPLKTEDLEETKYLHSQIAEFFELSDIANGSCKCVFIS